MDFSGAKIVLHTHEKLIVYLRDDKPDIPFPNQWDLPGGGREDGETPAQCALREVAEEFGLRLSQDKIVWSRYYPAQDPKSLGRYFLALPLLAEEINSVSFGDEGQHWKMMGFDDYLKHPNAVSFMQNRLRDYLAHLSS